MSDRTDTHIAGPDPSLRSNHLRRRLANGDAAPGTLTVDGAVMLTDVVGFTNHVEAMSAQGRHGLEDFTAGIASYIDRLVTFVLDRGGDVLNIAGDSLLCVWEADGEGGLNEVTIAAATTALALQALVHDTPLPGGRTLQTRIGVDAGPLTLTVAGGVRDQWELLTHGDTFARVDEAERNGEPGFVTLGTTAAELLVGDAALSPVGEGLHQIDAWYGSLPKDDPPAPVAQRLDPWALEFRRLSIALVRVPELAHAPPERVQEIVFAFQETVGRYEGASSTVTDNKGVRLLATFGTSGFAHEDDAARALGAIIEFARRSNELGSSCAAGVATGRVFHGVTGNRRRRARTLAGDVMNIAARLSTTAVDEVLCDQATAVAARNRYSFSVMNPIRVKGKEEPVPAFEPSEAIGGGRVLKGVVRGRSEELADLLSTLDDERVDVAVLVGEAGMGKSALLAELVSEADDRGVRPLVARADAIDRSTPFFAWAPILHHILGSAAGDDGRDPSSYVEPARALVSAELRQYAPILPSLLGGSPDGARVIPDEQRASIVPQLVADIVASGDTPAVVLMEDAHWADTASLAVLRRLVTGVDGPKVVVSIRPEGRPMLERMIAGVDPDVVRWIRLELLGRDAVRDLVADRLGVPRVPEPLLEFVHEQVAGNPYFCEQLLRSLVENGTVRTEAATVVVGELDASTIPSTVDGVIMGRFDKLDVDAQRCLKAASVVGRRHHVGAVQACVDRIDVRQVLDRVAASGLIGPVQPDWYEFQHVIARDVVYELMTDQQRSALHRKVAHHLAALPRPPGPATIGDHWYHGGEPALAVGCFERAAVDALNAGSFADSVSLLDRAAELRAGHGLAPDPERLADAALVRARASYYLGRLAECRSELESVIEMFDTPMPSTVAAHLAEHGEIEARRAAHLTARDEPTDDRVDTMLFESYRFLVKVLYLLAEESAPIVTASLRGLELADRLGRRLEGAAMQALVGGAYVLIGDVERYEYHADAAIAVAESPAGAPVANNVWRMVAVARAGLGDWSGSLDASDRALAAMDPAGRNRDSGIWQTRAAVHLCAGDILRAPEAWQRTADIAARDGNTQLARWSRLDEIQTLVGRGDVDAAAELLAETMVSLGRPPDPLGIVEQHFTVAIVRSAQGRHLEAVNAARSVIAFVDEHPPSGFHFVEFCTGALEVMVAGLSGDESGRIRPDELIEEIERGLELLDRLAGLFPHVRPRVPMIRATLAAATGRSTTVSPLLEQAREIARSAGWGYDESRAIVLMLELCPDVSVDPDAVESAVTTFRRLGLRPWIERAEVLVVG